MQYTEFLGITKLVPGQQQAHVVVNDALDNYDIATAGLIDIDLKGKAAHHLTGRESTHAMLRFINADRACAITVQARPKTWIVINKTSCQLEIMAESSLAAPIKIDPGSIVDVFCDGQDIISSGEQIAAQSPDGANALTSNITYYIRQGGNDSSSGLTAADALATVSQAAAKARYLKTNGYDVIFDIGPGTWAALFFDNATLGDIGSFVINGAGKGQTIISTEISDAIGFKNVSAKIMVQNVSLKAPAGNCLRLDNVKKAEVQNINFGQCRSAHLSLSFSNATVGSGIVISGSALHFSYAEKCSYFETSAKIVLEGTPWFTDAFAYATGCTYSSWVGATFVGEGSGKRYRIYFASCIRTAYGVDFFPGNEPGIAHVATGGCYA